MKLIKRRDHLEILPESEDDIAYLEDTLGLKADRDRVRLVRIKQREGMVFSQELVEVYRAHKYFTLETQKEGKSDGV